MPRLLSISVKPTYACKGTKLLDHECWKKYSIGHTRTKPVSSRNEGCIVQCSIISSASSATSAAAQQVWVEDRRSCGDKEEKLGVLVSQFGWQVRRLAENDQSEMREVAQIQAEAFHTPVALFDDIFFQFFKAEVLSGLLYKLRNSPPDRYACLVAEPADDSSISGGKLVGIVDVTALRDEAVLQCLSEADEYLYVSGIAVSKNFRRRKIASVLLKACDVLSFMWGFEYLVLRAYEDDYGAQKLYRNAGYKVVSSDPQWVTWVGRRRRVLMIKQSALQH